MRKKLVRTINSCKSLKKTQRTKTIRVRKYRQKQWCWKSKKKGRDTKKVFVVCMCCPFGHSWLY